MDNTRLMVARALCKVQQDKAWSNLVLDNLIKTGNMGKRDSAFAGALFYGVLERLVTLDACIAAHCSTKLRKLSPAVLTALRMGVYQALYLDSVPDSAAVNESVELVRKLGQPKSTGLVNAVLRSFLRGEKQIPLPKDPLERLGVEFSCPPHLVRLLWEGYGEQGAWRFLEQSLSPPPLYIRVNTVKTRPDLLLEALGVRGIRGAQDPELSACVRLEKAGAVQDIPQYWEGLFHVQDKSSQLCAGALSVLPGMRVLDACAAPGGKSFTLAQMMENKGELVATDLHHHRVELIEERREAMGLTCIRPVQADMSLYQPELGEFDRILCDVPCSGLGVIRRKPELKYKTAEEIKEFPSIQYKILENSAKYCKAGGLLIYSTCTLNPAENQEVADRFRREHPEFLPHPMPRFGGAVSHTLLGQEDTDGFFLAAFRKAAAGSPA